MYPLVKHVLRNAITRSSFDISQWSWVYQKSNTVNDPSPTRNIACSITRGFEYHAQEEKLGNQDDDTSPMRHTCEPLHSELWLRAPVKNGSRVSVTRNHSRLDREFAIFEGWKQPGARGKTKHIRCVWKLEIRPYAGTRGYQRMERAMPILRLALGWPVLGGDSTL